MSVIIHDKSPKTYIVLGSPSGGTSFIAKSIHEMGIDMGKLEQGPRRYEDQNFAKFFSKARQTKKFDIKKLKSLIKNKSFWGFKNVEAAFSLKPMLKYFKDDVYLVCVFRRPSKVARSIARPPSRFATEEDALKEAKAYYQGIIDIIQHFLSNELG